MKRLFLLITLVVVLFVARPVNAQSGSCPLGTDDLGGLAGLYPDTTKVCRGDVFEFTESVMEILSDGSGFYPCGQYVNYRRVLTQISDAAEREMFLVPPASLSTGQQIRVRFYFMQGFVITGPQPIKDWPLRFEYYDANRLLIGSHSGSTLDYPIISTYFGTGAIKTYYNVYVVDQVIQLSGDMTGGYFRFTHTPDFGFLESTSSKTAIASIQIGDDLPVMCSIPNYGYPPTATPQPTPTGTLTPTPTGTLTPTPTMYPTSIGVTVTPIPTTTPTPLVFVTVPAENTPTPWPPYIIPTVNWPTPYPTIMAMQTDYEATVQAIDPTRSAATDSLLGAAGDISTTWGTPRAQARALTDPNNTEYITTTTSTGTAITEYVTLPVGYMRGISDLMPNAWGFVLWLFALVGIVIFSTTSKFWLGVIKVITYLIQLVIDFLYKVWTAFWELIPL